MKRTAELILAISLLALCGCQKDAQQTEAQEEQHPLVKQGQAYMEINDFARAETVFKEALDTHPRMARPHLDLATIYNYHQTNYIYAIYHYSRYLELRPETEKASLIKEQIMKVQNTMVQDILTRAGAYRMQAELTRLQKENAALKKQQTPTQTATGAPKTKASTSPVPTQSASADTSKHQIYTVVEGDTLTKIAQKFYGNTDYLPIYEANRDRMKSHNDLRVGQTLVIPQP